MIAAWDGWRGNIYRLAVDPAHRRRVAHEGEAAAFWEAAGCPRDAEVGRRVRNL